MVAGVAKRFVVDSMLGKLAKWLRILGFDTRYEQLETQAQLDAYRAQGLLLITRQRRFADQDGVFFLNANDSLEQLREVVSQIPVSQQEVRLLKRCVLCNEQLQAITRERTFGQVPDYVHETQSTFHQCPRCRKIYWPGSHPRRMIQRLQRELGWEVSDE